jgi:hypothetical protein
MRFRGWRQLWNFAEGSGVGGDHSGGVLLYPHNDPRNDFNAKAGLSFSFGRR